MRGFTTAFMAGIFGLSGLCALSVFPSQARAGEATELARVSKWSLVYDDDSCSLSAVFGPGGGKDGDGGAGKAGGKAGDGGKTKDGEPDGKMVLAIFSHDIDQDSFTLELVGKAFRTLNPRTDATIAFAHGRFPPRQVNGWAGERGGMAELMFNRVRLDNGSPMDVDMMVPDDQLAAIDAMTVRTRTAHLRLRLGAMKAPWAAVKKCAQERIKAWGYEGYDPSPAQAPASVQAPALAITAPHPPIPRTDPSRWIRSDDFSSQPLFIGQGGMVRARLDVDASGAVVGCHPMFQTKPEEFASAACAALTRNASFRPAQDASGRNVKGFWIVRTLWVVP